MTYIGPDDYYFHLGLEMGHKRLIINPEEYLAGRLTFKSKSSLEAINAFKWGFYLGQELKEDEFNILTEDIIDVIVDEVNVSLEGNC